MYFVNVPEDTDSLSLPFLSNHSFYTVLLSNLLNLLSMFERFVLCFIHEISDRINALFLSSTYILDYKK